MYKYEPRGLSGWTTAQFAGLFWLAEVTQRLIVH